MRDAHFYKLAEIAPTMRLLKESAQAEVFYEMLSGALVWTDEIPRLCDGHPPCGEYLRPVFRYRSSLIEGTPEKAYEEFWNEANRLFPEWPGFMPSRRSLEHKQLYEQLKSQAMKELDDLFDK